MGSDVILAEVTNGTKQFQSTLPVWGATFFMPYKDPNKKISIHAPRVGSDAVRSALKATKA